MKNNRWNPSKPALLASAMVLSALLLAPSVHSAQSDISSTPIISTNSAQVKPNVMLLMDTSGSMGWSHMPDEVEPITGVGSVGYKNAKCNTLYYNRDTTYLLPKKPDGSLFAVPSLASAPYTGFSDYSGPPSRLLSDGSVIYSTETTVNLQTGFRAYDRFTVKDDGFADAAQPAYYYVYSGSQSLSYASAPCNDVDTGATRAATGGGTWTRVLVSTTSGNATRPGATTADETENFAIWYSFYRTRINLTKSAASLAFTPLTDSYRVGFITVQPKDTPSSAAINPAKYVAISDFNSTQRGLWFNKVFAQIPGGASPAREGLARVGRHYGGKQDGINAGMTGDPVQYSCQQNFTIMTTDGYWNSQTESSNVTGGPVDLNGVRLDLVGGGPKKNWDNPLTGSVPLSMNAAGVVSGQSPYPIFDGAADRTDVLTNNQNTYSYATCGTFAYLSTLQNRASTAQVLQITNQTTQSTQQNLQSTSQIVKNTAQNLQSTAQVTQSTTQNRQSTVQNLQSTNQNLQSTTQTLQSTAQNLTSTLQNLRNTTQNLQSTSQPVQTTTQITQTVTVVNQSTSQLRQSTTQVTQSTNQPRQSTVQNLRSTNQNLRSTNQNLQSTTQTTQSTVQNRQSTSQNLRNTTQNLQSTTQVTASTVQATQSTVQTNRSTSQLMITTTQVRQSTSQTQKCDASTELCSYVAPGTCVAGGLITCQVTNTGPTLVASCTPVSPTSGNNYLTTTCATTSTGPTGTASCTPSGATSGNSYTTTTCASTTTGPTPVSSCTPVVAGSGNSWTATTCSNATTGPTPVASCTVTSASSGNNWTATTCGSNTTGPTGVSSCTAATASAGNSYTATTCGNNNTTNVPVASCTVAAASAGNSWTATSCPAPVVTTNVPVASCTAAAASSGNSWTATSCPAPVVTTNVPVATCTAAAASSGNSWIATTCPAPVTTGPTGVSSCTAATASSGNSYTATTCGNNNTTNVPVASCTAATASSGNSWTATTCPAPIVTTNVAVATCTAASASSGNSWTTTTCPAPVVTTNVPVASCTAAAASSGNSWTSTTCPAPVTTGPTPVASCTAVAASSGNSWTATTCPAPVTTGPTGVSACAPVAGSAGNNWVTTTCGTNNTTNVGVASCTASGPGGGNGYTTTTCNTATTGPTPVATCTAAAAAAGNSYTATTCATTTLSGPTPVATCTPVAPTAGNGYQTTTCNTIVVGPTPVATCTPVAASAGNNWTATTCGTNVVGPTPVATCTPSGPTAGNGYTTTTCPAPVVTTNVPVAACTASAAAAGNAWTTTTCPAPVTTGPTATATCTAAAAAAGNSWTATTCTTNNTGPTAVASCTPITAAAGNAWTTTTCPTNNTTNVPVATCTASGPSAGNGYTTTTCPAPVVTTNVAVASCTPAAAASGNSWTTKTCSTNNTTNVPVATCTASAATSGNGWTTTTCPAPLTTGPTGVASCTPVTAAAGNSWVATTCGTNNTSNVPVATCTASGPTAGNIYTTTTCSTNNVSGTPASSCTPTAASAGNSWTTTTCPAPVTTGPTPVATCTASSATAGNAWTTTTCPAPALTGPTGVATCAPVAASAGNNWTATTCGTNPTSTPVQTCTPVAPTAGNGYTTTTCGANNATDVPVLSCTPTAASAGNSWVTTTCNPAASGPTLVTSCTPEAASAGTNWTATTCVPALGKKTQYFTTNTVTTTLFSGNIQLGLPTVVTNTTAVADVDGLCYAPNATQGLPGTEPPLPTPNPGPSGSPNPGPNPPVGCSAWPCLSAGPTADGSINSLADVAQYYYITDLRPGMANDVKVGAGTGAEADTANWQHMTTFTIALGVSGTLNYLPNYLSSAAITGDFADIRTGAKSWPLWPDPAVNTDPGTGGTFDNWNNSKSIDDFWHAAVNGRGQYFSTESPTSVVSGLSGALSASMPRPSAGAAAGASTLAPVAGDNYAFIGSYKTFEWSGDVVASELDPATGAVSSTVNWSAQQQLNLKTKAACDNRNIYLMRAGATNNLVNFSWSTQQCDAGGAPAGAITDGLNATERGYFGLSNVMLMSQYPAMSAAQRSAAEGANLVNFLRGQRGFENFESGVVTTLYRVRPHVLGDVVGGQPIYVKAPTNGYVDAGYQNFRAAQAARTPMLYVAANDGMLHALYAGTVPTDPNYALRGQEAWAIIPSAVLPNMWKLADANYGNSHQFYVDGTPVVGDVVNSADSTWRTMLVGGLNAGGKGYYAIDITDPATPKAMWEFKFGTCYDGTAATAGADCHLGLTFGKPIITKVVDSSYPEGRWVVIVSSGYNNVRGAGLSGDGSGYLYVLDAITGTIIHKIDTGAGSATTPSNLGQLNAYVDDGSVNNTAVRVYGGDMLGNIWRFDVNDTHAPTGREATLLGQARDSSNNPQPITTRPELAELNGKPMVFVSTGRMLGATDINDTQRQSMYGVVDQLTGSPVYSDLRGALKPMVTSQTGTGLTATRTVACDPAASAAACASTNGWVNDLPDTGERVNVDMKLVLGTLVIASNVPPTSACDTGGYSWFNYVDFATGNAVLSSPGGVTGVRATYGQTVGFSILRLLDGTFRGLIRGAEGPGNEVKEPPVDPPKPKGKRISWREIAQ